MTRHRKDQNRPSKRADAISTKSTSSIGTVEPSRDESREPAEESHSKVGAVDTITRPRSIQSRLDHLSQISSTEYCLQIGFVPNMRIPAQVYVNTNLESLLLSEFDHEVSSSGGGFLM